MFSVRKKIYGEKNYHVIIVFGGWGMKQWQLWLLGQLFATYHYKAIMYTYDPTILLGDPEQVVQRFLELEQDVLKTLGTLPKREQKNISMLGVSLGTIPAFMVANEIKSVKKLVINLSGSDLAEIVWGWNKGAGSLIKDRLLTQKVTLNELQKSWFGLSPIHNLAALPGKKVLLYLANQDKLIPFAYQQQLLQSLKDAQIQTEAIINTRHNHLVSMIINLLNFSVYIAFLRNK